MDMRFIVESRFLNYPFTVFMKSSAKEMAGNLAGTQLVYSSRQRFLQLGSVRQEFPYENRNPSCSTATCGTNRSNFFLSSTPKHSLRGCGFFCEERKQKKNWE
jgi:hypothetical protein